LGNGFGTIALPWKAEGLKEINKARNSMASSSLKHRIIGGSSWDLQEPDIEEVEHDAIT
jgi:hypothetical protein